MKKIFTYLLATAALIILTVAAMAQDGTSPFAGSSHGYKVTPGDAGNTLLWEIVGGNPSDYTVNTTTNSDSINITWNASAVGTTYTLRLTETSPAPTSCSTVKEIDIDPVANTFDVSTSNPSATCNDADGQINYSGSTATTSITFTVDMTTSNASYSPDWEFVFSLTPGTGATINNIAASSGSLSGSGPYTLTGLSSASGNGTVNITMDVTGDINSSLDVNLEITSAKELTYGTPDADSNDWAATQTINPIPATSAITTD